MKKFLLAIAAFLLTYGVHAQCAPSFTAAMSPTGTALLRVLFTNTSSIPVTPPSNYVLYTINYGDGSSAGYFNPTHNYAAPGTYNVKVVATKMDSLTNTILCKDSLTIPVSVYYTPCASSFTAVVSSTTPGLVTFTASTPAGTPNMYYYWNFGDGTSGTGATVSHTYATTGSHTVYFTAIDSVTSTICTYSYSTTVVTTTSVCSGHVTSIAASIGGATATFSAGAPYFAGQTAIVKWSFGDGTTGTGNPVTHTYASPGLYTVRDTVRWVDSANNSIIICTAVASATINIASTTGCAGHTASATYSTSGNTVYVTNTSPSFAGQSYFNNWLYGDGTATTTSTAHTYAAAGTYTIRQAAQWYTTSSPVSVCYDTNYFTVTIVTPNVISGYILKDSITYPAYDSFKVWLITYNSTTSTLAAVDSVITGGYNFVPYYFYNKPAGTYLTKAAKQGGIVGSTGLIPTYHDSSVYWSAAQNIVHTGGYSVNNNIWMKTGTVTSGPGFVGGNVSAGANKTTGAPIPNLLVMLRDASNKPIQMTYTNANGDFTFSNIPLGTYSVYPEQMNYITTPFNSIVLTSASHSKTGVNFGQTNTELKPKTTGITVLSAEDAAALYPNPSTGVVNISWKNVSGTVSVSVADVAGHKVYELPAASTATMSKIDLSALQNGIYFIHIATENGTQTQKMTILK